VRGAVAETLKYSTKPADMVADPKWFLELTRRSPQSGACASGGSVRLWRQKTPELSLKYKYKDRAHETPAIF
ncbi:hypothetical protein ACI3TF_29090, partial [Klebsiella pneumoniae]